MAEIVVTTNAEGKASVQVPPGKYVVDVQPPAGYRDAPNQEVSLADGETRQVSFLLEPQQSEFELVVADSAGNPLASMVRITPVS